MIKKLKNNKGITLLETILALALLGIIMVILIRYMHEKSKELQLQSTARFIERRLDMATDILKAEFSSQSLNPYAPANGGTGLMSFPGVDTTYSPDTSIIKHAYNSDFNFDMKYFIRAPFPSGTAPEEASLQIIMYLFDPDLDWVDGMKIARYIKNAQGGVVHFADSVGSACPGGAADEFCLVNAYGIWLMDEETSGAVGLPPLVDALTKAELLAISTNNKDRVPAIVAVSNVTISDAYGDFFQREPSSTDNTDKEEQTMRTDLNMRTSDNSPSIFFNGDVTDGNFEGTSLTFKDSLSICSDSTGDGTIDIDDYNDADGSGTITPGDTCLVPSVFATPALVLESNKEREDMAASGIVEKPMFISKGGLKTNLQKDEGTFCDLSSEENILAADPDTGHILQCYFKDDYKYDPSDPAFAGEWKKVDWKKSIIFFNENVELMSGTGNGNKSSTETLESFVGLDIAEESRFLILQVSVEEIGELDLRVKVGGANKIFWVMGVLEGSDWAKNQSRQIIIPKPDDANTNTSWLTVHTDTGTNSWNVQLIGYSR